MKQWGWVIQYGVAMLLAVLLGAILGSFPLFHQTALGETKLKASHLVEFIGYGGALLMFWLLARRLAAHIPQGTPVSILRHVIVPLATLIVTSAGYQVLLLIGAPFLGKTGKTIYNWLFVIGIGGSALWLVAAWFRHSESLTDTSETSSRCPECGASIAVGVKFCNACGHTVSAISMPKIVSIGS